MNRGRLPRTAAIFILRFDVSQTAAGQFQSPLSG